MQKKNSKIRVNKQKSKRWTRVTIVMLTLFFSGLWIGRFIYNKNNTVCEASTYENNKQNNNNLVVTTKKDNKNEEEKNKEELKKNEELRKKEEQAKQEKLKKQEEKRKQEEAAKTTKSAAESNNNNNYSYAVNVEEAYKKDGKKVAFLTFDDGPTRNITPEVLDTLKRYDVKATFFVLGKMAEQNKDLIKRIINEGHAIANHTYSHEYNNIYSSSENFWREINKTDGVLKSILGQEFSTRVFRFPGGSVGGRYEKLKVGYRNSMKDKGYCYIDWNVENGDGKSSNFTPERLLQYVKQEANGHEDIIVLMHDASTKKTTAQALPSIIEYLKAQGFEFKVLK